ncbi:putative NADP-dependent alcohol dehydrogenase C 2 [Radiomyces spectabilis]|uniref:putative NADP-dependent alcohol dehydrogenase C 2 n=1 Tax=Radiomyces spectabilis TaxID=64574 RepID=UPI00221FAF71|nr:putative NADP-dependent alcohol dehydrogenase C 2 [Radiomyces spectabilis]KAI8388802.1 putative NADP-dependent alcohol dehydrogenase C 2 [Radiomyces spectabilis]
MRNLRMCVPKRKSGIQILRTPLEVESFKFDMTSDQFVGYVGLQPLVLNKKDTYLQSYTFAPRPLDEDEVEISVSACGICGSDIHQLTNGWKRAVYPLIPGHEFIGKITAVGSAVKTHKVGDRVGVSPVCRSCGSCRECQDEFGQLCPDKVTTYNGKYKGYSTFGGYADRVRVQESWAIKIPENIGDEEGAPLLCAGITTYLPFKHYQIGKDATVGIVGIGGLGHLAIQWAKAKQCRRIVAISSSSSKAQETAQLGATDFVVLKEGIPAELNQSIDYLFVCGSGKSTDWGALLGLIRTRGKMILLDVPEQPVALPPAAFLYRHISIVGSFVGSNGDLQEMLDFASQTGVRPWIQKVGNSLNEVNRGVEMLMTGQAHYRIVICGEGRQ